MAILPLTVPAADYQRPAEMNLLNTKDGLAGETVFKIYKSHWGVIWIATSNGVSSFDGMRLKSYRVGPLRSQNRVNDIEQSADGWIWCATVDGVYKVNGAKVWLERAFPEVKGNVYALRVIDDKVYVGASNGLYIGETKGNKPAKHIWLNRNHVDGSNNINDIQQGENGKLWILSDRELYLFDMKTLSVKPMGLRQKLHLSYNLRVLSVVGNRIFIGTYNDGIFVFDTRTGEVKPYIDVNCRVITCLSNDGKNLYVGTDGAGLSVISLADDRIVETYSTSSMSRYQLKDNTVYAFLHDPSGVNFFGYFRQGFHYNYYVQKLFDCYALRKKSDGTVLFDSRYVNVRSICIDGSVKVLGSRGGLYYIDEEKELVKFFSPDELGGSIVTNVIKYHDQYYCCTFNGGVMRIDPKTLHTSRFGTHDALRTGSFGSLVVSPDDELWMAGNAGVFVYNAETGQERVINSKNSRLPDVYCNSLLFDRLGRCWISTAAGLCLYDPSDGRVHTSDFPDGFFSTQKEPIGTLGDKDNLIFYSLDGLFRTNEEMTIFEQVKSSPRLLNTHIAQAIYDKKHQKYWMASTEGLFRYDSNFQSMHKFAHEAALESHEFSYGAIHIDKENRLWVGTMEGLYYANLDKAESYSMDNDDITLQNITVNDVAATDRQTVDLLRERSISLYFHWGNDRLSFVPVLTNYCKQEGLSFEYRVRRSVNEKRDWQVLNNGEAATIARELSFGKNIVEIRLSGQTDVTTYDVYLWPSAVFILELILIIVIITIIVYAVRERMLVLEQREAMAQVQRELEEAKRKYGRVHTSDDEQHRLYNRLDYYMMTEKPYLDNDLKLSDVAAHLGISTVKLSQLFSTHLNTNYYDFINKYRLSEFKERVTMPQYKNYTLLALAEECGFKRSSFFSTFKKVEGVTPTEYMRKL